MSFKKLMVGAVAVMALGFSQASAADVKAGVGLIYVGDYGAGLGGLTYEDYPIQRYYGSGYYSAGKGENMFSFPYNAYGLNAFLDVTYAEISASYVFGTARYTYSFEGEALASAGVNNSISLLNIGVLGKFPLPLENLPDNMTVYPAFGLEYRIALDVDGRKESASEWFSTLFLNIGVIYDQAMNESMFVRGKVLFGFGLPSKFGKEFNEGFGNVKTSAAWGYGLTIGGAIGFKF